MCSNHIKYKRECSRFRIENKACTYLWPYASHVMMKTVPYLKTCVIVCNVSVVTDCVNPLCDVQKVKQQWHWLYSYTWKKNPFFQYSKYRSVLCSVRLLVGQFSQSFGPVNIDFFIKASVKFSHWFGPIAAVGTLEQWYFVHNGNIKSMNCISSINGTLIW